MDTSTILFASVAGVIILSVLTFVMTGSVLATIIVVTIIGMVIYTLYKMGYITVGYDTGGTLNVGYHETAPSPTSSKKSEPKNLEVSEVFYVGGNDYVYDEASAVCAAYGADLATYDEVNDAYAAGGEWCGYGWTQGGMALFPTQQATWELLQQEADATKRTACGRPGVNGGYFNPSNKFGVNCYGVKPGNKHMKFPLPVPGTDTGAFNKLVDKYKGMLSRMTVDAFNRTGWSEWNASSHGVPTVSQLKKDM